MTYSDDDQLTSVYQTDASGTNSHISNWEYDGLGRKTFTREFSWDATANGGQGDWSHDSDKRYIYDGMDVVQERDWNNDVTANYTRVGNIGGLLGKSVPNGSSTDHFYYHYDGGGNVVQLTSSAGNSVGEYSYDAYGNATRVWGFAATANTYRFSTKEWHGFTGLYSYGYRFYSPQLGRWTNRDPINENSGLNLYKFVRNNAVNLIDHYGLKEKTAEKGEAPGIVKNYTKYWIPVITDTYGETFGRKPDGRVEWVLYLPPGWQTNPTKFDADYTIGVLPGFPWTKIFGGTTPCNVKMSPVRKDAVTFDGGFGIPWLGGGKFGFPSRYGNGPQFRMPLALAIDRGYIFPMSH